MNNPTPLVIANLKANKTWDEVVTWIDEVAAPVQNFEGTVIFCPSYPFLVSAYEKISQNGINLKLGSQDISRFDVGAYTGEVAASQISDLVKFAIIGHSERRENLKEDKQALEKKVKRANVAGIETIFCIQSSETPIPEGTSIVAYEPVFAIGTGNPDNPQNIQTVAQKIKKKGNYTIIYGGSVSEQNVASFATGNIDGVLVGATNSLDPQKFIAIIKAIH